MEKFLFQNRLLNWYERHKRDLPWRRTNDPYKIWLSEVILQQTRVQQGLPYYQKFLEHYPSVRDLAEANLDQVLKDWEGLGYYSRARNLHQAAQYVSEELQGQFPTQHDELLNLKGVGAYTAAAVSSFAGNAVKPVVDGNVQRVLSRIFGIEEAVNTTKGKKQIDELAAQMISEEEPGRYNQAIMEFGALHCTPRNPACSACPLQEDCYAYREGKVDALPLKKRKKYDRHRYLHYLMLGQNGQVLIRQRDDRSIWKGLYEFPLIETTDECSLGELRQLPEWDQWVPEDAVLQKREALKPHKLSHQTLHIVIYSIEITSAGSSYQTSAAQWVESRELMNYGFPRPLRAYLDRDQLTLPFK